MEGCGWREGEWEERWGLSFGDYGAFICILLSSVSESEGRGSDTQQGAEANRRAAEVQGSEAQQKSHHHSLAGVEMLNKLGDICSEGREQV